VVHYRRYKDYSMKAIVCHRYGSPDVLELEEIDRPIAGDDQVLVRVQAASVNPVEWHRMRGLPNFMRAGEGLAKPKNPGLGADVAGRVEAVGGNVRQFQPGGDGSRLATRS
jgi:NADPH:quinone reductase-like Zn-dependent oxidoreductase